MRTLLRFDPERVRPDPAAVWQLLGPGSGRAQRHRALLSEAERILMELAAPAGLYQEITGTAFAEVFHGEGRNHPDAALARIFPLAEHLALFAATLGPAVSKKIQELFAAGDFVLGAVLDAAASAAADLAAARVEESFGGMLRAGGPVGAPTRLVRRYSPGYCGWDLTGQRRLFDALQPGEIGLALGESCLMEPLKSVSGVLLGGPPEIHRVERGFPYCGGCRSPQCYFGTPGDSHAGPQGNETP